MEEVAMEVFDPTGATEVSAAFASRLDTLKDKKVAMLSNGMWQVDRMFDSLAATLKQRFPSSSFTLIPAREHIQSDETIDAIVREGYDAVVVGNAA
jgi:hypothetical protein